MDEQDSPSSKAIEAISRLGYVAKGVVFVVIGGLAALAAFGLGGETTDAQGAIHQLAAQPFGKFILIILTLGLAGHVTWRMTQALADAEGKGRDFTGIVQRVGFAISGLVYTGLAIYALDALIGAFSNGGGSSAESRTAQVMALPGGRWLVGLGGVAFIGVGIYQMVRSYSGSFRKHWKRAQMSGAQWTWANRIARLGLAARGVVFGLIGFLLLLAAIRVDPEAAEDQGGALQVLAQQPYGTWVLALVALGLICYGVYCFTNARYRVVDP
jgi:hypothetical protein